MTKGRHENVMSIVINGEWKCSLLISSVCCRPDPAGDVPSPIRRWSEKRTCWGRYLTAPSTRWSEKRICWGGYLTAPSTTGCTSTFV